MQTIYGLEAQINRVIIYWVPSAQKMQWWHVWWQICLCCKWSMRPEDFEFCLPMATKLPCFRQLQKWQIIAPFCWGSTQPPTKVLTGEPQSQLSVHNESHLVVWVLSVVQLTWRIGQRAFWSCLWYWQTHLSWQHWLRLGRGLYFRDSLSVMLLI